MGLTPELVSGAGEAPFGLVVQVAVSWVDLG